MHNSTNLGKISTITGSRSGCTLSVKKSNLTQSFKIGFLNVFSLLKTFSKSILGFRYLYHQMFSDFYHLGGRVTFGSGITVHNPEYIFLGNKVFLNKNVTLKFLEEFAEDNFKKPALKIDDEVTIGECTVVAAAKFIHIEKDVLIGPHCFIGDHDHQYRNVTIPIRDQGYKNIKRIVIKAGAWIGSGSTICSGVTVGKNSVVGANSVVTQDVPDFSLAVGAPAKVVKKFNFSANKWVSVETKNNKK